MLSCVRCLASAAGVAIPQRGVVGGRGCQQPHKVRFARGSHAHTRARAHTHTHAPAYRRTGNPNAAERPRSPGHAEMSGWRWPTRRRSSGRSSVLCRWSCLRVCVCLFVCLGVCVCADGNPLSTSAQGAPLPQHRDRDVAQRARPPLELALPRSEAGRRESKRGKEI